MPLLTAELFNRSDENTRQPCIAMGTLSSVNQLITEGCGCSSRRFIATAFCLLIVQLATPVRVVRRALEVHAELFGVCR